MEKRIPICLMSDNNYAPPLGVTIYSAIKNADSNDLMDFYIFDNGISDENIQKIKNLETPNCSITFIDTKEYAEKINDLKQNAHHITKTSYLKFFMADILKDFDKIIYLDSDLVIEKPLSDLFKINIDDYLFASVEDVGYTYWCHYHDHFKLDFKCINNGVMLINSKKWREENLSQQLIECAKDHDKLGFGQDQPVFNYVCRDRILFLEHYWNVQDTYFRDGPEIAARNDIEKCHYAKNNPYIVHYNYDKKPWNTPFMLKGEYFWKYYLDLPFLSKQERKIYKKLKYLYKSRLLYNSINLNINEYTNFSSIFQILNHNYRSYSEPRIDDFKNKVNKAIEDKISSKVRKFKRSAKNLFKFLPVIFKLL